MSSILKALKKLEQEKAARRESPLDIGREILRGGDRGRRHSWLMLAATSIGTAVVAVVATILVLRAGHQEKSINDRLPASPNPVVAPAPAIPAAIEKPAISNIPKARQGRPNLLPKTDSQPPPISEAVPGSTASIPSTTVPLQTGNLASPNVEPAQQELNLQVTGIAYQLDAGPPIAVVNGRPVSAGAVVDGATVLSILPDKVIFSKEGASFEVHVGQSFTKP